MPAVSAPARAAAQAAANVDQRAFDFLMPFSERRTLLSVAEVAQVLGRTRTFVEAMIDEAKLEVFAPQDRQVERKRITRRSVLVLLAEQAQSDPAHWMERVLRLVDACSPEQLTELIVRATQRRARL